MIQADQILAEGKCLPRAFGDYGPDHSPQPRSFLISQEKSSGSSFLCLDLFTFYFFGVTSQYNYIFRIWIVNLSPSVAFFIIIIFIF